MWRYYNNAIVSDMAPHETPDISEVRNRDFWKKYGKGKALLARYTSDFDSKEYTNWWYCIKDSSFDINSIKAKRRYEIKKGIKNFTVKVIEPECYDLGLYQVYKAAADSYNEPVSSLLTENEYCEHVKTWKNKYLTIAAFSNDEDNQLAGFCVLTEYETYIDFNGCKSNPKYEGKGVNAALVFFILEHYKKALESGVYISDGQRNIFHDTHFQEYLVKYFEFRYAYCKLNVLYRPFIGGIITLLYPFKKIIKKIDISIMRKISGILRMEEILREQTRDIS